MSNRHRRGTSAGWSLQLRDSWHEFSARLRGSSIFAWGSGSTARLRGPATIHDVGTVERLRWLGVDAVAVLGLLALATIAFWQLYQTGWLWVSALGGAVLGVGIGAAAAWRRWPTWIVAVAVAVAYLVTGSALAMPQLASWSVVPNARTLSGLVFGVVQSWKRVLTIDAPIGVTDNFLIVPLITMLLAGVLAITIATRSGRPGLAWLPPAGALVTGIAFGLQTATWPVLLGIAFAVTVLLWTAYRRDYQRQTLLARRRRYPLRTVGSAFGVLLVAGLIGGLTAPLVMPDARQVIRDEVSPPLDVRHWPSPLQSFRSNVKDHREDVLFTVDGLPEGAGIRAATLDAYDGITFNASSAADRAPDGGQFKRIGSRIPDRTEGEPVAYTVQIEKYADRWIPTIGQSRTVDFSGERSGELAEQFFYNRHTGTGVSVLPLRAGDRYRVTGVVAPQPSRSELAEASAGNLELPDAGPIAEELTARAQEWTAGVDSDGAAAIKLETELQKGYYSHGLANDVPSLPGHNGYRMMRLMIDHEGRMVGDEEQYAVAMALMARELGMPSRVVYGYRPGGSGTVAVTGDDVSAWVEINFDRFGWVEFFPTPEKSRALPEDTSRAEAKPRPQVENPPPPPERPEDPPPNNTPPLPGQEPDEPTGIDWQQILRIGLAVLIPLVVLLGPVWLILGLKRRRRIRRMTRGTPVDRIAGGWGELVDRARDLGAVPVAGATRSEHAAVLVEQFGQGRPAGTAGDTGQLAQQADWASFSGALPSEPMVQEYWSAVKEAGAGLAASVNPWRRLRGALSLRSLLRR